MLGATKGWLRKGSTPRKAKKKRVHEGISENMSEACLLACEDCLRSSREIQCTGANRERLKRIAGWMMGRYASVVAEVYA